MELGSISLTAVAPNNDELQRTLTYNPVFLTAGIELSDDPLVPLRSAVYPLSVAHRRERERHITEDSNHLTTALPGR